MGSLTITTTHNYDEDLIVNSIDCVVYWLYRNYPVVHTCTVRINSCDIVRTGEQLQGLGQTKGEALCHCRPLSLTGRTHFTEGLSEGKVLTPGTNKPFYIYS